MSNTFNLPFHLKNGAAPAPAPASPSPSLITLPIQPKNPQALAHPSTADANTAQADREKASPPRPLTKYPPIKSKYEGVGQYMPAFREYQKQDNMKVDQEGKTDGDGDVKMEN